MGPGIKKLIGGALAVGSLLLAPAGAQAKPPSGGPTASSECLSLLYPTAQSPTVCKGYTYTCISPFYPKQLAVFTNSDTIEDQLEVALRGHYWRCTGTPDD
jgi:hypothetical protein